MCLTLSANHVKDFKLKKARNKHLFKHKALFGRYNNNLLPKPRLKHKTHFQKECEKHKKNIGQPLNSNP